MNQPGDEILLEKTNGDHHIIIDSSGVGLPLDPYKNVATVAIDSMLSQLGSRQKFHLTFLKKIAPGSGIGSSAASSAGAVFGANELLGNPYSNLELVPFAMKGEEVASGSAHADNVAPALLGGFVLIRSYEPLDIIPIPAPEQILLLRSIPRDQHRHRGQPQDPENHSPAEKALIQCGNVAGLVTGLITGNFRLIRDSMHDVIAEPIRSFLIPEYDKVKKAALDSGALGCSISGSGPSIFALCKDEETAKMVGRRWKRFLPLPISAAIYLFHR